MLVIESANNVAIGNTKLIAEKIVMPRAGTEFSRTRLIALLRQSLESCAATIVSGRAGTGKTSLALDFARRCDRAVAWYKVDAPESDLDSFFRYLIASIQKERPSFGAQGLIPILQTSGGVEMAALAEAFIYDLVEGEKKPLLIVIEDLHLVSDSEWLVPFLRRVLPLLPASVHILITSRTMPPSPLWRMRSKRILSVIAEEYLAFTREEAVGLFESYGLSSEHAGIALDHTGGRAAALTRFAEMLMQAANSIPSPA